MPTRQLSQRQRDFGSGMWRDVAGVLIPENGCYDALNIFFEEDGAAVKRGGTVAKSNAAFGARLTFIADAYLDPGQRTLFANPSDFGVLASDDASPVNLGSDGLAYPKPYALLEGMLFIGGGYVYGGSRQAASYSTGTVTATNGSKVLTGAGTTWNTLVDAGMLFQAGSERPYVIASVDSPTQVTLRDAYAGATGAGKSYTFHNLYKITAQDPLEASEVYGVCANRLLLASGNIVRFSAIGDPATIGQNDFHELPEGVTVTGLGTIGQTALLFTTRGIWTLDGLAFEIVDAAGNGQHRLALLSRDQILWGQSGIAGWDQALIVPCADGVYLFDGIAAPQRISHPLDDFYMYYVHAGYRPGQAAVYKGHYFLPICDTAGTVREFLVCRLNHPVRIRGQVVHAWSRFDGHGGKVIALAARTGETTRQPLLLGASSSADARVVDCQRYLAPEGAYKRDSDATTPVFSLITRDYETGNDTINQVRSIRLRHELVDAGADNPLIRFASSHGRARPGQPSWDQVNWNEFSWAAASELAFDALAGDAPESDGTVPHRLRVNRQARHIRFSLRNAEPAASCVAHSLEVFTRPSRGVRR